MSDILKLLIPFGVIGAIGGFFGLMLGIAAKFWKVEKDERIDRILGHLPGANCGGCGFSGCSAFAEAVTKGKAPCDGCKVCDKEAHDSISGIMGVAGGEYKKHVSVVACSGIDAKTRQEFKGALDCLSVAKIGGDKLCPYACIGLGSCVESCKFDAISIKNGIAVVDDDLCTACGACAAACPKRLISVMPENSVFVACSSRDAGKRVRELCEVGCIGCRICEKTCESGAITVVGNLAVVNGEKCTGCGKCIEKCPRKIIKRA